jgi:hypothetical protein
MLRHVLAHNGGSEDVIVAHLATLLRPGGCLYLVDADGTAVRTVPEDVDLEDLLHDTSPSTPRRAMTSAPGCGWVST